MDPFQNYTAKPNGSYFAQSGSPNLQNLKELELSQLPGVALHVPTFFQRHDKALRVTDPDEQLLPRMRDLPIGIHVVNHEGKIILWCTGAEHFATASCN
jgi:hypothetical protein